MAAFYTDGTFTSASAVGPKRWLAPLPGNEFVGFEQDFWVLAESFSPVALGTAYDAGTYASYRLVAESAHSHVGGGILQWTRTYWKKPADRSEYESYIYNFIGYYGVTGINVTEVTGRDRFTRTVLSRIDYSYYFSGAGLDVTDPDDIPLLEAQKYYVYSGNTLETDFLADDPPFTIATDPARTEYENWIALGTWIVAEDSIVRRVIGNLYERSTRYVKAQ